MCLGHADRPDYDRLVRILEKGKTRVMLHYGASTKSESLVDREVSKVSIYNICIVIRLRSHVLEICQIVVVIVEQVLLFWNRNNSFIREI